MKPLTVITFAAWLNFANAAVMTVMSIHLPNERQDLLVASAVFVAIGAALIALLPAKQSMKSDYRPRRLPVQPSHWPLCGDFECVGDFTPTAVHVWLGTTLQIIGAGT